MGVSSLFASITVPSEVYSGFTNGGSFNDPTYSGVTYNTWKLGNNLVNFVVNANPAGYSQETLFAKLTIYFSAAVQG